MSADVEALARNLGRIIHRFDCEYPDECAGPNFNDMKLARECLAAVLTSDWLTANVARLLSEERERVATAIEDLPGPNGEGLARWNIGTQNGYLLGIEEAAAIARAGGES